jgi:hypothetical protein
MAIKFEKIQAGMTLFDVRRNTGMTRNKWNIWPVYVKSVDSEKRTVQASWNGNAYQTMGEYRVTKFRAKKPEDKAMF